MDWTQQESLQELLSSLQPEELLQLEAFLSDRLAFSDFLREVSPTWRWDWAHLVYVQRYLELVTSGELRQLMLFLPPRHGKSEMTTVRYPVYRLEMDPTARVIVGAYNQTLADKFSRKARRIALERHAAGRLPLNTSRLNTQDWETAVGGGFRAVGVGGGVTGQGGNLIIVDDPVKSREEAESETYQQKVYDWYTDDLFTRLEPGAAIILIMTRWHEQDLAGQILGSEDGPNWTVVSLPALAEENDPLGRGVGEALCPERYDVESLRRIRTVLRNSFWALYQQRPQPREGSLFKRGAWRYVNAVPVEAERVRYWDRAASESRGDMTAGVLMARAGSRYYVEDVVMGQWGLEERDRIIRDTAEKDAARYGNTVRIFGEEEPGSAGKDAAAAFIKLLAGFPVRADRVSGSKETRAEPLASQQEAGNVSLLRAPWNARYVEIMAAFPRGKFDDPVDASSGAFNKLAVGGVEYAPGLW